jgi:hypothetical protein
MIKTVVAIHQWALYHNEAHFKDPFSYHPERFLGDPRFDTDNLDAFQPFHIGPRNCVGRKCVPLGLILDSRHSLITRSLAYAEMRLILARVIFNYDMIIADESRTWIDQKVWNLWKKGPLFAYLTPVHRDS